MGRITTPTSLLPRFHESHRALRLIPQGSSLVVALSGGIDSVVLLDLLAAEREALGLDIVVAHFNHSLRGDESEGDEQFVLSLGVSYNCRVYVERADTAERALRDKKGVQETARTLRYEYFQRLRESLNFEAVATAHNADDNAETVLFNLLRGTGLRGLGGIPLERDNGQTIRPLLFAARAEIESHAAFAHLSFRNDSSNDEDHYTRNFLRHNVLPVIREKINPSVSETLLRNARLFRDLDGFLQNAARSVLTTCATRNQGNEYLIDVPRLMSLPELLQQYVVRMVVCDLTGSQADSSLVDAILDLRTASTGSWVPLPGECWMAHRHRDTLVLRSSARPEEFSQPIDLNRTYELGDFEFSIREVDALPRPQSDPGCVEFVDADLVGSAGLLLRTWKEGDWFIPLGLKGRKKISDFFIDAHVPLFDKKRYPVLANSSGEVVWLCGQRIDDRFKVSDATRRLLKLEFHSRVAQRNHAPND